MSMSVSHWNSNNMPSAAEHLLLSQKPLRSHALALLTSSFYVLPCARKEMVPIMVQIRYQHNITNQDISKSIARLIDMCKVRSSTSFSASSMSSRHLRYSNPAIDVENRDFEIEAGLLLVQACFKSYPSPCARSGSFDSCHRTWTT